MADNDSEALACTQDRPTPSADPSEPPLPDVASGLDRPKSPADDKDLHNYIDRYLTENEVKPEHADALKAQIATDLGDWGQANKDLIGRLVDEHFQRAPQGNAPGPVRSNVDSGGDPVELFSGELAYSVTDFVLAGAGIDFQFTRTYRNQVRFDGPLGVNWTHAYHLQLWESPDRQRLILSTGELRELTYTRHPRWDYYVPPDGDHAVLTEAGASFERREPDGLRHVFEPDPAWTGGHRLSRVEDANGNYLALSYVDDQLTLVEVNHPQRTVDFGYDVAGRIDRITDHTGRTWRYGYDDFGDLIYFTTPSTEHARNGLTTCYEYSTGNAPVALGHNLIRVTDPNGESYLDNDYGQDSGVYAYNRVIRQRQGGGETLLEYERVVSGADDDGYPEHQRPAWQTNEIDPLGHPVHRVYNAYGNLLLREESVTRAGHVRLLRWRYRYNADGNLTAELSPLGALTQYYYGRDDYRRRYDVTDAEIAEHEELTARERQAFGDLLMVIRRRRRLDLEEMDLSRGVWGDIFPDVIAGRDPGDIVVRYSYDPDYHGLATVSDPRSGALTRYEYAGPRLIAVHEPTPTLPDGTSGGEVTTRYLEHDSRGRLLHSVDPVGVHTRYSYHDSGVRDGFPRTTIVDPDGFALTTMIEVDELGRAVAVHSPNAALTRDGRHVTRYRYNALDQLVETIGSPPFRYSTRRFYDPNGQLSRIERDNRDDSGGALASGPQTTVYEYDERLNLRREGQGGADPGTRLVVTHTYDAASRRTGTRLPEGNLVRHAYDERHRRIATTEGTGSPLAATSRTEWDDDDRPEVTISPLGHRTRVRFDVFGRLIEEIDPLGNVARFSYDEAGNLILTRIFEPTADGGHALLGRSEAHFDELNRSTVTVVNLFDGPYPVSSLDEEGPGTAGPGRRLTSQLYLDAAGRPVATVDPLGARTTYFYDTAGRLNETVDALGNRASHGYDPNGNLLRTDILEAADSGFRAFAIAYRYDELDREVSTTDSLGNTVTTSYDSLDRVRRVTDALGHVRHLEYDIHDRVVAVTDEVGTVRYGYDRNGNLSEQVDALGRISRQGYDELDRPITLSYPDGSRATATFDRDSEIVLSQDPAGRTVRHTRDALGRTTHVELRGAAVGATYLRYAYNGIGALTRAENDFAVCEFEYNSLGWARAEVCTQRLPGTQPREFRIVRGFNDTGFVTTVEYPADRGLTLERDELGRLTGIYRTTPSPLDLAHFDYQGLQRVAATLGNGTATAWRFDGGDRPIQTIHTGPSGPLWANRQLFDGSGNVRLRVESDPEGSVHDRFSYDARDRLTGHTVATGGDFDPALFAPASQRLADPIPRRQAAMDAHFGPADPAWIYDAAGNRADHAVNELDQYADLGYDGNGNLTDDGVRQYGYSADDTLVSIVDSRGTTEFYHDPFGRRIAELRPDGGLTQLVWDSTQLIAEYRDGDLHAEYAHEDDIDHPLHLTLAGAHYWYHSDPTGSVRLITDAAGSTAARYDFTPFGEAIRVDGPRNPLRFVARRIDASGTYDFRARQYHPGLGRFLQRDPGGTTDSTNLYAYVDNNPLKYVDPFGAERQNPSTGSAPPSVDSPPPPSTPDAPPAPDATALPDPAAAPSPGDATAPPVPPPSTGHIVKEVAKGVGDFAWETLTGVARLITPPTPEDIIAGRDPLVDAVRGVWGNIRARAVDYGGGASGYAQSLNENLNPLIQGYLSFERARKAYARGDYRAAGKSGAGGVVSVLPVGAQAVKIAGKVAKKALWQKHHVLTGKQNQVSQHPIWQKAGITAEHKINKIDLPVLGLLHPTKSIHRGRHLQRLADKQKYLLDKLEKLGDRLQWSPNEYLRRLSRLLAVERRKLLTGHRGLNKHRRPWAKDEKKYWP